jgi:tryptophan synthase beta chain
MQNSDGQIIEPYSLSAGLDYPGIGPLHAHLITTQRATVYAATDEEAMDAVLSLSKDEGIIPALETAHALAILDKMKFSKNDHVVICLSGRGDKDLSTFIKYLKPNAND